MWTLNFGNAKIANYKDNRKDHVIAKFSMFRGPNYIIWRSRTPHMPFALTVNDVLIYEWTFGPHITVKTKFVGARWCSNENCMEFRFIPDTFYHLSHEAIITTENITTLRQILENLTANNKSIQLKIEEEPDPLKKGFPDQNLFNGLYLHNERPIDYLATICKTHKKEMLVGDKFIGIADYLQTDDIGYNIHVFNNSFSHFSMFGKEFISVGSSKEPIYPSQHFYFHSNSSTVLQLRCIHTSIDINGIKKDVHMISNVFDVKEVTKIEPDPYEPGKTIEKQVFRWAPIKITEEELIDLLDDEDRQALMDIYYNNSNVIVGKTSFDAENDKFVKYNNDKYDLAKTNFIPSSYRYLVTKATPYAGPTVGLQFPINNNSISVDVKHDGKASSAIEVGQIYQKNNDNVWQEPRKDSEDDFRFTLPDGTTVYYEHNIATFTICGKQEVIVGIQSDIDYKKKPDPTIYVKIKSDGTIDIRGTDIKIGTSGEWYKLATELHRHFFQHIHTCPAGPSGPPQGDMQEPNHITAVTEGN